jgi:NAD(P)-dependent dehydrogenase (short-subunit alcohol dehydrogenase family)
MKEPLMMPESILLTDRVALVTGGASGIGQGIALGMARFGADVVIADIDEAGAKHTAERIQALGRRAVAVRTDVFEPAEIRAAIASATAHFGRLDILINNAGGSRAQKFVELSERSIERQVDINLTNLFVATGAAAKAMIACGRGGAIVNVASIEGQRAAPGLSVYAACKAAMINFSRTMALELAEHNIRVNVIAPDIVITPGLMRLNPGALSGEQLAARARYIPLGRDGTPDDCAGAAVFLCSAMSSYITGAVLSVDGGTFASSGWTRETGGGWSPVPSPSQQPRNEHSTLTPIGGGDGANCTT